MAIRRTNGKYLTASDIGKYAHTEGILTDGICSRGWKIEHVSKSRVYMKIERRSPKEITNNIPATDIDTKYVQAKSVLFVADTEEESEWLNKTSKDQRNDLAEAQRAILNKYEMLLDLFVKKE